MHNKSPEPNRYHSQDWCHALWIQTLGMRALPPVPKEIKPMEAALGVAHIEPQARDCRR